MVKEKPKLDREEVLEKEDHQQRVEQFLLRVLEYLGEQEYLGEPRRENDRIVIPVLRRNETEGSSAASPQAPTPLQALAASWMDAPAPEAKGRSGVS